jgi:hypothetical protein
MERGRPHQNRRRIGQKAPMSSLHSRKDANNLHQARSIPPKDEMASMQIVQVACVAQNWWMNPLQMLQRSKGEVSNVKPTPQTMPMTISKENVQNKLNLQGKCSNGLKKMVDGSSRR